VEGGVMAGRQFDISDHAAAEADRRGIPRDVLDAVLQGPQQIVPERRGRKAYQSRVDFRGKIFLVRAIVDESVDPASVVTAYRDEQDQQVLEADMKVTYDPGVDVLRILLSSAAIEESDEEKPGVIIDYDKDGNVVGLEILDASKRMENPRSLEYAVTS
jgi:uncharacterized protein YuzE